MAEKLYSINSGSIPIIIPNTSTVLAATPSYYWQVIDIAGFICTVQSNFSIFNLFRLTTRFPTTSCTSSVFYFPPGPTISFWIFIDISEHTAFAGRYWKKKIQLYGSVEL